MSELKLIACPLCSGDAVLDCPAGCTGDDGLCLTCGGSGPNPCPCGTGEVAAPKFCPDCLAEREVSFAEHEVFSQDRLERLFAEGRFTLRECEPLLCEFCLPVPGVGL